MRILVVEDYTPVRASVVKALQEEGYSVDQAITGDEGLLCASGADYDVIVLDVMLPGIDGLELLRRLRRAGNASHVLILTARDKIEDKIDGLDLGADDYLVKPFAMSELVARVRALVRRGYGRKQPVIRVGYLEINTNDHGVRASGERVDLTAREYALLEYLAFRAGQVVSRTEIWEHLYDDHSSATSNVVDVYVGYLRRKIEGQDRPRLLHTRRGEGYCLSAETA